ncbi:site-specific integrase [Halosolutus halophilus]|uniref:site-specific integrase n=1 Tax=Halosolutus halophilus TaxID=1552990 RepID=UPI0022352B54|nr:site-specific integrase [Halosolutus halophilus]
MKRFQYIDQSRRDTKFVFSPIRGTRLTRERIRKSVRKAADEANEMDEGETRFHKKFTPHTFRTVFTTEMRKRGMPDYVLQYIRGDSESETMDIYTDWLWWKPHQREGRPLLLSTGEAVTGVRFNLSGDR